MRKTLFLLTRDVSFLKELRGALEPVGYGIRTHSSFSALLLSCYESEGCVVLDGNDLSHREILNLVQDLRKTGFTHAVLVTEKNPTLARAIGLLRLPIQDYFQLNTAVPELRKMFQAAFQWSETEGHRQAIRADLKQCWELQDDRTRALLRLLYQGLTNQEAAKQMNVSLRTIENRRAKLLEVFGVSTFAELIRIATEVLDEDPLPPAILGKNPQPMAF
ncbi:MAG: LuxR C-terminal-related transcriptional regulator [Planctomycetia bacterium]|nr:LuxR C-terminal-related transcriptional regulator [Planctomycetia bacterium]